MTEIRLKNGKFEHVGTGSWNRILTEEGEVIDITDHNVLPGFIDVHNHGAIGVDVNSADREGLIKIGEFLLKQGVTGWLPTLVPDTLEAYQRVINAMDEVMQIQPERPVAQILGVHYEGLFANSLMCGALHKEHFLSFENGNELDQLPLPKTGVKMMTYAPEIENGISLTENLISNGWVASIGHTNAKTEVLDLAFDAGARHLTHFFNAMTGLHHRDLGVVGWGLSKKGTTFDIIADGIHVQPEMLKLAINAKGIEDVSLISDSIAPTGLGDGDYKVWGEEIAVSAGRTSNSKGSIAGSVITIIDAVRQLEKLGFSVEEIGQMASTNPARLLGLEKPHGIIENGKRADMVVLDKEWKVLHTFVAGFRVHG